MLTCALIVLSSPAHVKAQSAGAATVRIVDFDYQERAMAVTAGTTITWTNTGTRPHTATDRGGTFDTDPISPGAMATVQLDVPGTYFYFCEINPKQMNGTIVVNPGPSASPVVRVQAVDNGNVATETFRFDPPELTIDAGTSLVVANVGGERHSLTFDDGSLSTPVLPPGPEQGRFAGTNISLLVPLSGTFPFHCQVHPELMRGVLTVRPPPGASSVVITAVPETSVRETSVVATSVPETSVPETSVVTTSVPETSVPETSVVTTSVPGTSVPETSVPSDASLTAAPRRSGAGKGFSFWGAVLGAAAVIGVVGGAAAVMRRRAPRR